MRIKQSAKNTPGWLIETPRLSAADELSIKISLEAGDPDRRHTPPDKTRLIQALPDARRTNCAHLIHLCTKIAPH